MTTASLPSPEPTAPGARRPVRPQLRRSNTDRMVGGVCGGIAEYSGIDSLLWRVGFVALTLAGGSGVLVYLLLWVLMPPAARAPGDQPSAVEQLVERMHAAATSFRASSSR